MKRSKLMSGWNHVTWRWMVAAVLLMWTSGVLLYVLPAETLMEMSDLQVVLRHASLILHGVLTWLLCVLCGRGLWPHVRVVWQRREQRAHWIWGLISFVGLSFVAGAGVLLLYGSSSIHDTVSVLHWWVGGCCVALAVVGACVASFHPRANLMTNPPQFKFLYNTKSLENSHTMLSCLQCCTRE